MHYLIDGYNLLFRNLKAGDTLQDKRKELTTSLEKKLSVLGINATLIFDSHYREDEGSRGHLHNLEIIFTNHGETADAYILKMLKESSAPQTFTVVTSDKVLARLCRLKLAHTEEVDAFMHLINKRYKNKIHPPQPAPQPIKPIEMAPPPPVKKVPAKGSIDYYLEQFEGETIEPAPKEKPAKEQPKKKAGKSKPKPDPGLSDEERWLKAFERDLNDSDSGFAG